MGVPRTNDEITRRIDRVDPNADHFGFQRETLLSFLPYEVAKPYLRKKVEKKEWHEEKRTPKKVRAMIEDVMPVAWERANGHRFAMACASIGIIRAYMWMLGYDQDVLPDAFTHYGKPQLRCLCDELGINWSVWDDGIWNTMVLDKDGQSPPLFPHEVPLLEFRSKRAA